jgi:hypothetical protein
MNSMLFVLIAAIVSAFLVMMTASVLYLLKINVEHSESESVDWWGRL